MENKQWMHKFLEDSYYTKDDIHHIVGERMLVAPDRIDEDILKIVGPPSSYTTASGPFGK